MELIQENKESLRGVRSSNIELFRILSMLVIVAHHYVVNSGLWACIDARNTRGTITENLQKKGFFKIFA